MFEKSKRCQNNQVPSSLAPDASQFGWVGDQAIWGAVLCRTLITRVEEWKGWTLRLWMRGLTGSRGWTRYKPCASVVMRSSSGWYFSNCASSRATERERKLRGHKQMGRGEKQYEWKRGEMKKISSLIDWFGHIETEKKNDDEPNVKFIINHNNTRTMKSPFEMDSGSRSKTSPPHGRSPYRLSIRDSGGRGIVKMFVIRLVISNARIKSN